MTHWRVLGAMVVCSLTACVSQATPKNDLWDKLAEGGYVLLIPHADATAAAADSAALASELCAEQGHLSRQGRSAAQQLKHRLQGQGVSVGRVLTSHDCRCIETAAIVFGRAEPWDIIDDTDSEDPSVAREKTVALREAISRWGSSDNLALVSHQDNIARAFGVAAQATEMHATEILVIEPRGDGGFRLLGRLPLQ